MAAIRDVLKQYHKLNDWCAQFWNKTYKTCSNDIACSAGCGICCELQSVNILESYSIYMSLTDKLTAAVLPESSKCVFLVDDKCSIYGIRPQICRTHGLAIKSKEFISAYSITCPYNFSKTDLDCMPECILDIDMVTENLMKLNYAFCLLVNLKHLASERILLKDIAMRTLSLEIAQAFASIYE